MTEDSDRAARALPFGPLDAGTAHLVDYAAEIREEWLDGVPTVSLTSGASVPDELVMQVLDHLAQCGFRARWPR